MVLGLWRRGGSRYRRRRGKLKGRNNNRLRTGKGRIREMQAVKWGMMISWIDIIRSLLRQAEESSRRELPLKMLRGQ